MLNTVVKKFTSVTLMGVLSVVPFLSLNVSAAVAATPKLEITNSVDKQQANRGETLSYTITVKNTGDIELTNTIVWINEPNLADYIPGSSSAQGIPGGQTVKLDDNWIKTNANLGKVPAGKSVVVKYQTKVAQNANHDNIVWSVASADSDQTGRVTANSWTRVFFANPGLVGEKLADKTTVSANDTVTFTIKAKNTGNIVLNDVFIGDVISAPFKYVAGSTEARIGTNVTKVADTWLTTGFNAGYLNPGQEVIVTFKVTVSGQITDGQNLKNVASIKSNEIPQFNCEVKLKAKVLGVTTPEQPKAPEVPTKLPDTGAGEVLLLTSGLVPAGFFIKKLKASIK